ncbi:hypothetical protein BU26DRAFT_117282 [Trematosphaeria pertusa]|uniref:Uncharacterized protein n=1 Tax=Trematosphaeria pertusa TaxID=390896 RepID=A0A6A6I1F2_9PLEO|nr:uncharacterized protein BU26DRAFT_117282 [Trematosphaeria pertusa]KAF2243410.1 hypothetical protein BU26DRAFT_117282 [Trematosphaeria pertusa]
MTIFVNFTMGAKEAYFFNSPTHWAWHNLLPDVEALFTKQPPLKDVIEFALGDNGTYFVSYRDHDGQIFCRHYNLPNPLTEYLYHGHPHVIRDLSTLSISLGPYESYYAHDKTSASWSNLPPALEKAVLGRLVSQDAWKTVWKENGRDAPSFVSLGADGSYFMRAVGGGGSWELKSKEDGMVGTNKFLNDSKDFTGVAGLYLFAHHPNSYVLLLTSGKAFSNLPEHTWADYNKMAPALPPLVQTMSPIPCTPQPRQQAPAPVPQPHPQLQPQQRIQTGCCPTGMVVAPHNCCVQTPQIGSPFGLPSPFIPQMPTHFHSQNYGATYAPAVSPAGGYGNPPAYTPPYGKPS